VVARERVAAVYCKRTGETVPRASITLADDTFDGLRVVLWRTHAGADVGARPSPNCWHPPASQPAHRPPPRPAPLPDPSAGVGDVVHARGLRARWNAYAERPEASTGWSASLTVLATACDVLRDPDHPRRGSDHSPIPARVPARLDARCAARAADLAKWAVRAHGTLLRSVSDAAERRLRAAYPSARVPAHATVADLPEYSVAHFLGRVVHVAAVASRARRESVDAMGATARPTLWLTQGHGTCVEAILPAASAAETARALAEAEGRVVELRDFLVWRRFASGRHCLVAPDPGPREGRATNATWRVLDESDERAAEVVARCPLARHAARADSLRSIFDERRPRDAALLDVVARVAWVRLPASARDERNCIADDVRTIERDRLKRPRATRGGGLVAPEATASALLTLGCVACGREVAAGDDGAYRPCACVRDRNGASAGPIGYVWRGFVLGLVDAPGGEAIPARVEGALVAKLLFGTSPGDAAWSRARRLRERVVAKRETRARTDAKAETSGDCGRAEPSGEDAYSSDDDALGEFSDDGVDHLAVATAALNALAAGASRNAPFEWRVRAPRLDDNGVPIVKSLEVVGFEPARRTAEPGGERRARE
jgi:hypothetical protein